MSKIKILFGLECCEGGAAVHLIHILKYLDREIFESTVIVSDQRENSAYYINEIKKYSNRVIIFPLSEKITFWKDIYSILKARLFLNKNRFNIIHLHSSKAGFIFRITLFLIKNKPLTLYTPHHYFFETVQSGRKKIFISLEKIAGYFTDYVIAVSTHEMQVTKKYKLVPDNNILLIKNAIDTEYLQISDASVLKKQLSIPADNQVIGAVGRFTVQKDWTTYLKICKEINLLQKNITFPIIGYGELSVVIKKQVYELGLSANTIIIEDKRSLSSYYALMDVVVNTSLWESCSYTILEAMIMKRCVVASNITANSEMITHNVNGFLVNSGDYGMYADIICKVLKDKALRIYIGEKASEKIKKDHSIKAFTRELKNLYLRTLEKDL